MNKMGYFFDVNTYTLRMTKAFERKSCEYGSNECKILLEMRKMFPDMKVEIEARKTHNRVSYKKMKEFISLLPSAQEDLKEMERQQSMSLAFKSPYKYMETWFNRKYPYHGEYQVRDENNCLIWNVAELMSKKTCELVKFPDQQEEATA